MAEESAKQTAEEPAEEPAGETERRREIQPADPRLRRIVLLLLAVVAVAGAWGLWWLEGRLDDLLYVALRSPQEAAEGILGLAFRLFVLGSLGAALCGAWFFAVSWKTLRSERYPPPDVGVVRPTRIVEGRAARIRGLAGLLLAVFLLVLAVALPTVGLELLQERLLAVLLAD